MKENILIHVENGEISYDQKPILSNVNIEIRTGECVYLIGKTGSGKTSFLRILYGDLSLSEGIGNVAGFNLRNLSKKEVPFLRRKLGIIFQDFQLLTDRTVAQNLHFVMKATGWNNEELIGKRIHEVLSLVSLEDSLNKMPYELSGGEQQRVVIARALLNDPLIILADEPTGNLDPDISDEIIDLLHKIKQSGTAVLIATHDYRLIKKFPSRVIKTENGKLVELN